MAIEQTAQTLADGEISQDDRDGIVRPISEVSSIIKEEYKSSYVSVSIA